MCSRLRKKRVCLAARYKYLVVGLILDSGNAALKSITGSGGGYLFNGTHCKPLLLLFEGRIEAPGVERLREAALGFPSAFLDEQNGFGETPGAHAALAFIPESEPGVRVICQAWKHLPKRAWGLLSCS